MINTFDTKNFDEIQKFGKDSVDAATKSLGAVSKSAQAIAVETVDYSKKAFEEGTAALEKLFGAKVFLQTFVKVRTGWADDEARVRSFGYE